MPAHPLPFPGKPSPADRCSPNFLSAPRRQDKHTCSRPRSAPSAVPRSPEGAEPGPCPEGRLPAAAGSAPGRLRTYLRLRGFGRLHQVLLFVQRPEADVRQENQSRGEEQRHLQKPLLFPLHGQSRAALLAAAVSARPAPRDQALPCPQSLGGARRRGETSPASRLPTRSPGGAAPRSGGGAKPGGRSPRPGAALRGGGAALGGVHGSTCEQSGKLPATQRDRGNK